MDDDIVEAIRDALEAHRVADHTGIPPAESLLMVDEHRGMVANIDTIVGQVDFLVGKIAGECEIDEATGNLTGHRLPGIASRVEDLEHRANGGGGFSVRTRDKIIIGLIAAAPGVATAVVMLVR